MAESTRSTEAESTPNIEDIITEEGILCSILSNLTLREAVRTSVLSRRWRHLWTYCRKLYLDTGYEFLEFADSILQQLQGREIDELVLKHYLQSSRCCHVDAWLRFAVSSKARVLALYLKVYAKKQYGFPCWLLGPSSTVEDLTLKGFSLKPPPDFDGLRHLKKLELRHVIVTDECIIRLLSSCYTLEDLRLEVCPRLVTLRLPQHLNRLQKLAVRDCDNLMEIKIDAVNFKSLFYWGFPVDFIFRDYSQLKETHIVIKTTHKEHSLESYLNRIAIGFPQLQTLTFGLEYHFQYTPLWKGRLLLREFNSFLHLKRLDFCWNLDGTMNTSSLESLLDASPYLEELCLCYGLKAPLMPKRPAGSLRSIKMTLPIRAHTFLKTVQIDGFYYVEWHIKIALYLLKNAINLESMKIKLDCRGYGEPEIEKLRQEREIESLRQDVPPEVKLVIL